jgi:hypothetical protein
VTMSATMRDTFSPTLLIFIIALPSLVFSFMPLI